MNGTTFRFFETCFGNFARCFELFEYNYWPIDLRFLFWEHSTIFHYTNRSTFNIFKNNFWKLCSHFSRLFQYVLERRFQILYLWKISYILPLNFAWRKSHSDFSKHIFGNFGPIFLSFLNTTTSKVTSDSCSGKNSLHTSTFLRTTELSSSFKKKMFGHFWILYSHFSRSCL